ncbi:unnamed protein product, partial [Prorocentrum cordatum]
VWSSSCPLLRAADVRPAQLRSARRAPARPPLPRRSAPLGAAGLPIAYGPPSGAHCAPRCARRAKEEDDKEEVAGEGRGRGRKTALAQTASRGARCCRRPGGRPNYVTCSAQRAAHHQSRSSSRAPAKTKEKRPAHAASRHASGTPRAATQGLSASTARAGEGDSSRCQLSYLSSAKCWGFEYMQIRVRIEMDTLDGRYGLSRVCLKPTVRGLATGTAHRSGRSTVSSATSRRGGCSRRLPPFAVLSASSALPALQVLENTLGLDLLRGGRGGQATRRPRHFEDFVHTDVSWTSACDTCIDSGRVLRVLNVEDRLPLSPYLFARPRATRAASVATCAVARNAATGTTAAHPAPRAAGTRPASEDQTTRAASAHSARYASRSPKKDWRGHSRGCSLDGSPRLQPASPPALPPHPHGPARLPNRASSFAAGSRRTRYASRGAPSSGARSTAEARIAALFLNVQHFWPRLASQSRGS